MTEEPTEQIYTITGPPVALRVLDAVAEIPPDRLTGIGVAQDRRTDYWYLFLIFTEFTEKEQARIGETMAGGASPVSLTLEELFRFPLGVLLTGPERVIRAGLEWYGG